MNEPMTGEAESVEQAVGKGQEAPLPLLRVYLFGEFQLAWQVPSGMVEAAWDIRRKRRCYADAFCRQSKRFGDQRR